MTSGIVHFYFFRFRHIIRQFRHFLFLIGLYKTDHSTISLRVAAKTRTKPTDPPPTVERTNMTLTMASCQCCYPSKLLSWTWRIYSIQYVKVDIWTNKPLNDHFRFRLSCRLRYRYRPHIRVPVAICSFNSRLSGF